MDFFFNIIFLNRYSKYNTRKKNIPEILHRRRTAGRNSPFGPLTAETLLSACGRPTCMRSGQAAVRAPSFRPAEGRIIAFGALAAETGLDPPDGFFFLLSSPSLLPSVCFPFLSPSKKAPVNSRLISKNSQQSIRFIPQIKTRGQGHPGSVHGIVFGVVLHSVVEQWWATMEGCGGVGGVAGAVQRWW